MSAVLLACWEMPAGNLKSSKALHTRPHAVCHLTHTVCLHNGDSFNHTHTPPQNPTPDYLLFFVLFVYMFVSASCVFAKVAHHPPPSPFRSTLTKITWSLDYIAGSHQMIQICQATSCRGFQCYYRAQAMTGGSPLWNCFIDCCAGHGWWRVALRVFGVAVPATN